MNNSDILLLVSTLLFCIGGFGVAIRRNAIITLMSVELMLNAAILCLVSSSAAFGDLNAQVLVLFIMMIAAAEAAVGLAIISSAFLDRPDADLDYFNSLKW